MKQCPAQANYLKKKQEKGKKYDPGVSNSKIFVLCFTWITLRLRVYWISKAVISFQTPQQEEEREIVQRAYESVGKYTRTEIRW